MEAEEQEINAGNTVDIMMKNKMNWYRVAQLSERIIIDKINKVLKK